ncbi:hypothetical protein L326_09240 [Yersinia pestis 113]|nr:hypothetical protein [Yersinia pestis]ERP75275.1 hypothetical protein L326_09240 [Yersinia pestis 113]
MLTLRAGGVSIIGSTDHADNGGGNSGNNASTVVDFDDARAVMIITHGLTLCWLRVESMVTAICAGGD